MIKEHIIKNFKDSTHDEIISSIDDSLDNEEALPGLGVFFTLLWNNYDHDLIIDNIIKSMKKES